MESKKVIKICGVPHTITEHDDSLAVDTHFGMIDYAQCEIRINRNLPEAAKRETMCHEVLHGMLVHIGRDDLSADETFVQSLGNAIFQSFRPIIEEQYAYEKPKVLHGFAVNSNTADAVPVEASYTPSALRNGYGDAQI